MANVHAVTQPLVSNTKPYPPGVAGAPVALRNAERSVNPQVASALESTAADLTNVQASLNAIHAALRSSPSIQQLYVTDNTGKVIAAIGDFAYKGVVTPNYFSEIHVGDTLGTGNPAQALFNAAGDRVTIGQNGIVEVLDPFGNDAAWIGAQADTLPVTGAADNGGGLIRLTVTGHTLATGDSVQIVNVGGMPNATGIFIVTNVDANHVDLQNSVFVGTYTSGGTVNRILHVTGAANNGSGLIRITITAHGYVTGDEVNILNVGGVPNATGQWIVTVVTANTFDLQGSTWGGGYTSGGTCLRYFAGMLAQTIAIGPSFPGYKLRAFADGSLRIANAIIDLVGSGGEILIDPTLPDIVLTGPGGTITLDAAVPNFTETTAANLLQIRIENGAFYAEMGSAGVTHPYPRVDITALGGVNLTNKSGVVVASLDFVNSNADAQLIVRDSGATHSVTITGTTGTVDASAGYKFNGTAGVTTGPSNVVTNATVITFTLQYKDWTGTNQSATVANGINLTTESRTFQGGIRTL
jgi:hypothetical protein